MNKLSIYPKKTAMTPEQLKRLQACTSEIAEILYENTPGSELKSLETIEKYLREQWLEIMGPQIGGFFIKKTTGTEKGRARTVKSCLGELKITEKQAEKLGVKKSTRLAPLFEKCCLRQIANLSYEKASTEIEVQTGVVIGHTCLHRLVSKQEWAEPIVDEEVKETSVDGGKVRLRGAPGEGCHWLDYKVVRLHDSHHAAFFQENQALIDYVNCQPLAEILTCLGDGHDGLWNLIKFFNPSKKRREVLDWYHLIENLYKIGGSLKRLERVRALLWEGRLDETLKIFQSSRQKQAQNFCAYLQKHRFRIVNYKQLSSENICSIGSGAVESSVKQIDRRLKISGAQWLAKNVNQMLRLRCAYLNDLLSI